MDLNRWVEVFDSLLPRSRAWNLVFNRVLKKFFHGIAILPKTLRDHIGSILLDMFPTDTDYLEDWSKQLGSPTELTASELEAEFADTGGQDPSHIQGVLQDHGFTNLFVHEWWYTPAADPPVARNPIPLTEIYRVLVNDLSHAEKDYLYQFGDDISEFAGDDTIGFGEYNRWFMVGKQYPTPDIIQEYPLYYYVCSAVWPVPATILESELDEVKRLIYKTKPCHLRCILCVNVVPDSTYGNIQDTTWHTDWIQDTIDAVDIIQDKI